VFETLSAHFIVPRRSHRECAADFGGEAHILFGSLERGNTMIVGTCWYLAGLLSLAALTASAITVVPGHDFTAGTVAGCWSGSLLFAAAAVFLHAQEWRWICQAKLARYLFLGFAALITTCFLPLIVG